MLARYSKNKQGKLVKQADIYMVDEHNIRRAHIDSEACLICERLNKAGYEAYIVGGAIRDLLCHTTPKDWDIVTNAHPAKVKKICGYARIIGRRFKLVHVIASSHKIFEVATFRSLSADDNSIYGTLEEDAFRRDFTLNALYYDVRTERIIDFHEGYKHIQKRIIYPVVSLATSFEEDPVRMIRALKYAHATSSKLDVALKTAIKKNVFRLKTASASRLSDELIKALAGPVSEPFFKDCYEIGLLKAWLPNYTHFLDSLTKHQREEVWQGLAGLDAEKKQTNGVTRGDMVNALLYPYLKKHAIFAVGEAESVIQVAKKALAPIILPNRDLADAIKIMYACEGVPWRPLKERERPLRGGKPRRRFNKTPVTP